MNGPLSKEGDRMQDLKLFSGNANVALARSVASYLDVDLGRAEVGTFSDGECAIEIGENVRGLDCFALQSTCAPQNSHLMELLIMIDALKRASARRITAVIPYYGYARQDRKVRPRVPITAKLVADLIQTAGADRVLCMDLHSGQIQGFFNIPVDNLYSTPLMLDAIQRLIGSDLTVVSPDAGGTERARGFAKRLGARLVIIDKRREVANVAEVMNIIGDVKGQNCVIVDDLVDTAGTLCEAARSLMEEGGHGSACRDHASRSLRSRPQANFRVAADSGHRDRHDSSTARCNPHREASCRLRRRPIRRGDSAHQQRGERELSFLETKRVARPVRPSA